MEAQQNADPVLACEHAVLPSPFGLLAVLVVQTQVWPLESHEISLELPELVPELPLPELPPDVPELPLPELPLDTEPDAPLEERAGGHGVGAGAALPLEDELPELEDQLPDDDAAPPDDDDELTWLLVPVLGSRNERTTPPLSAQFDSHVDAAFLQTPSSQLDGMSTPNTRPSGAMHRHSNQQPAAPSTHGSSETSRIPSWSLAGSTHVGSTSELPEQAIERRTTALPTRIQEPRMGACVAEPSALRYLD